MFFRPVPSPTRLRENPDHTPRRCAPPLLLEGIQSTAAKVPSRKLGRGVPEGRGGLFGSSAVRACFRVLCRARNYERERVEAASFPNHFKNAGIFSPAIVCSNVSRALISSKLLPRTSTSAAIGRAL